MDNSHFTLASCAENARAEYAPTNTWRVAGRTIFRYVALLAVVCSAACQSAQSDRLDGAINSYESKNWKQSLEQASVVQNETSGAVRDQAAFLAGLSAYQMGNYPEAQTRFQISEQSMDAETAGESKVMLGDVMVHQKRYGDAANYYDAASNKLTGESSRRAKNLAAAARDPTRAGKVLSMAEPAMSMNGNVLSTQNNSAPVNSVTIATNTDAPSSGFEKDSSPPPVSKPKKPAKAADEKPVAKPAKPAVKPASDASNKKDAKPSPKSAGKKSDSDAFVIQAGSFILETSAKNRAKELTKPASRNGIETPKVVASKTKSGQRVWTVYLGEFATRAEAEKAIKKLGRKDLVVVENPK